MRDLQAVHGNAYVQRLVHLSTATASQSTGTVQRQPTATGFPLAGMWSARRRALEATSKRKQRIAELKASLAGLEPDVKLERLEEIYKEAQHYEGELGSVMGLAMLWLDRLGAPAFGQLGRPHGDVESMEAIWFLKADYQHASEQLGFVRRMFPPSTAEAFKEKYRVDVKPIPGGCCMTSMYKGFEVLQSPAFSKELRKEVYRDSKKIQDKTGVDTNSVDRVMRTMRSQGRAGDEMVMQYKRREKKWEPDPETELLSKVSTDFPGWYFFGLSVSGAYHTVTLVVDTTGGTPVVWWMDQFTRGFTKNVTGKLSEKMQEDWLKPSYGFATTRIWPILPPPESAASPD